MTKFDFAFEFIMKHEDHQRTGKITKDAGGLTRWGIASRYNHGVDLIRLTLDGAKEIYRRKYWAPYNLDRLRDAQVAAKCFDMIVNPGPASVKLIQRIADAETDGIMGPITVGKLNLLDQEELLRALCRAQADYYHEHDCEPLEALLVRAEDRP